MLIYKYIHHWLGQLIYNSLRLSTSRLYFVLSRSSQELSTALRISHIRLNFKQDYQFLRTRYPRTNRSFRASVKALANSLPKTACCIHGQSIIPILERPCSMYSCLDFYRAHQPAYFEKNLFYAKNFIQRSYG